MKLVKKVHRKHKYNHFFISLLFPCVYLQSSITENYEPGWEPKKTVNTSLLVIDHAAESALAQILRYDLTDLRKYAPEIQCYLS